MDNQDLIQVDIFGLSLTPSASGGGYAIILKEVSGERRLPIIIGQFEAQAIALELEGIKPPRPLTHDLIKSVVENLGSTINAVIISELKDSTFFAKIRFDDNEAEDIDARPSDAIAIALKFTAPIYVASEVMEEVGFVPDFEEQAFPKHEGASEESFSEEGKGNPEAVAQAENKKLSPKERKLKQLKVELDEAVLKEDYEKAALLRDEIKKLEISNLN
jgi:bifunctional DNase/RNase